MSDESTRQASPPPDAPDGQPQTQDFPAYQPPQPLAAGYPGQPQWAAPAQTVVVQLRKRDYALVGLCIALSIALVVGLQAVLGYMWIGDRVLSVQRLGDSAQATAGQAAQQSALGSDLREGAVFVQSNNANANEVVAFARGADGKLREVGRYPTGGKGSGSFEDSASGIVLGTAEGEASPTQNIDKAELLFVSNAGSSTISVFRLAADKLELVDHVSSGGQKPVSITVNRGLLYVLNSGEFDNRFVSNFGDDALENCVHGQLPSVTGFRVAADGKLTKIDGSSRPLTMEQESGCAQAAFTPNGKALIVTERVAGKTGAHPPGGWAKGVYLSFPVRENGTLGAPREFEPTGNGPFGFTFTKDGTLIATEQNGAFANPGGGYVAAYSVSDDGTLQSVGPPTPTQTTDPCWIVITDDQKLAFASAVADGGAISSFAVARTGQMTLLHRAASAPDGTNHELDNAPLGLTDLTLSRDSRYLYQLNSAVGLVHVFAVNGSTGTLTHVETHEVFDLLPLGMGGEGAPFGIAAF
jgi:6-phosphogluconolactonase